MLSFLGDINSVKNTFFTKQMKFVLANFVASDKVLKPLKNLQAMRKARLLLWKMKKTKLRKYQK